MGGGLDPRLRSCLRDSRSPSAPWPIGQVRRTLPGVASVNPTLATPTERPIRALAPTHLGTYVAPEINPPIATSNAAPDASETQTPERAPSGANATLVATKDATLVATKDATLDQLLESQNGGLTLRDVDGRAIVMRVKGDAVGGHPGAIHFHPDCRIAPGQPKPGPGMLMSTPVFEHLQSLLGDTAFDGYGPSVLGNVPVVAVWQFPSVFNRVQGYKLTGECLRPESRGVLGEQVDWLGNGEAARARLPPAARALCWTKMRQEFDPGSSIAHANEVYVHSLRREPGQGAGPQLLAMLSLSRIVRKDNGRYPPDRVSNLLQLIRVLRRDGVVAIPCPHPHDALVFYNKEEGAASRATRTPLSPRGLSALLHRDDIVDAFARYSDDGAGAREWATLHVHAFPPSPE
jgi:hypothetical protein